jgi:uncharacterized protein
MSLVSLIFSCRRCGACCQGTTTVSLNEDDRAGMVLELNMPEDEIRKKFWRITGNEVQMKTINGHCIFYNEGCTVHAGRPRLCAQWPLHPSILSDENNFTTIANSCPGINKTISYRQFCETLREILKVSDHIC